MELETSMSTSMCVIGITISYSATCYTPKCSNTVVHNIHLYIYIYKYIYIIYMYIYYIYIYISVNEFYDILLSICMRCLLTGCLQNMIFEPNELRSIFCIVMSLTLCFGRLVPVCKSIVIFHVFYWKIICCKISIGL